MSTLTNASIVRVTTKTALSAQVTSLEKEEEVQVITLDERLG